MIQLWISFDDRALLALQGPKAAMALANIAPEVSNMVFMDAKKLNIAGVECIIKPIWLYG